jgi:IK cytokine
LIFVDNFYSNQTIRWLKQQQQKEKREEQASRYRDRAKERREGLNPDYEEDRILTSILQPETPGSKISKQMEIETRKLLGGDFEHTHLVKGLDYVLLQRIRSEMEKQKSDGGEASKLESITGKEKPPGEIETKSTPEASGGELLKAKKAKTHLAKTVLQHLKNLAKRSEPLVLSDKFLGNRTTFVFELNAQTNLPTTLLRSKEDCKVEKHSKIALDPKVTNRINKIMQFLRNPDLPQAKRQKPDRSSLTKITTNEARSTPSSSTKESIIPSKPEPNEPLSDDE